MTPPSHHVSIKVKPDAKRKFASPITVQSSAARKFKQPRSKRDSRGVGLAAMLASVATGLGLGEGLAALSYELPHSLLSFTH